MVESLKDILQKEVSYLSQKERADILIKAGITAHIGVEEGLAMKVNLALPWKQRGK